MEVVRCGRNLYCLIVEGVRTDILCGTFEEVADHLSGDVEMLECLVDASTESITDGIDYVVEHYKWLCAYRCIEDSRVIRSCIWRLSKAEFVDLCMLLKSFDSGLWASFNWSEIKVKSIRDGYSTLLV